MNHPLLLSGKLFRLALIMGVGLALYACVEIVDLGGSSDFEPELVVEGSINDLDEQFTVRLSTTATVNGISYTRLGRQARVSIYSDAGDSLRLLEEPSGVYTTVPGALTVSAGVNYQLDIVLEDGRHYQSSMVSLPEPIAVLSSFAEPVDISREDELGVFRRSWVHDIFLELENTVDPQYFKVNVTGWQQEIVSYSVIVLAPQRCWAFKDPAVRDITIGNNLELSGEPYWVRGARIPTPDKRVYIAETMVQAMSLEAHQFWLEVRTQLDRDKGVFTEPFAAVNGNIRNVNDDNEVVHGYFHAYAQSLVRTCYDSYDLPLPAAIAVINIPCVDYFSPAVYELPFEEEALCE